MMSQEKNCSLSQWIKKRSEELGFSACGISKAEYLVEEKERLEKWLEDKMHGEMGYMDRNIEKRLDPRLLVANAKTVISFLYNYFPKVPIPSDENFIISKYAYGRDYHLVIKEKLYHLIDEMKLIAGDLKARAFTDSAPILERAWARRGGLGWIGKNTCLIHPKLGSFHFLAEIVTDVEMEPDRQTINDLCGDCTRCIDSCPTGAIIAPRVLDSRKCISYLTIEYRGRLPKEHQEDLGKMIFGCDICQDVCPWNRFSRPHGEKLFEPGGRLKQMRKKKWKTLKKSEFEELFKDSALQRTGYEGMMRNIEFVDEDTLTGL
jgi:epoxyqueuosine reductase